MPIARTTDNVALSYKTNGSGRCHLLFMHDWGGSGAYFDSLLKQLDFTNLRTISYDMRGHGNSDAPEMGYTLQRFAQDAFDVVDHAGAAKVILVGFGMGAKLAQYAATFHRERINGLILIGGCPASSFAFSSHVQNEWFNHAPNRAQWVKIKHSQLAGRVNAERFECWADDVLKIPQSILETTLDMMTQTSFADRLVLINCPIMIVGGLHDPIFPPKMLCNQVAAPLGNARLIQVDCSHEIPLEQPLELAGLILAFLAGMKAVPLVYSVAP